MKNKIIEECTNGANSNRLGKISYKDKTITNSDVLQSFSIDSSCYVDGIIGSVYSKNLKVNLIENNNDISNQLLDVEVGIKFDEEKKYIPMGKYKVEKINNEVTMDKTEITAYDELYSNLDNKYICHLNYDEEVTVKDLYIDVCNNLNLIPVKENILNGNITISNNPFTNNETNRTVLETISKIACSFVTIDNETNKIDLSWLNEEINYTFYTSDYTNVEKGITYGPINCLIIKNKEIDDENITIKDEEDIEINGEHALVISEDYILYNAEERMEAIEAIWNRVKGFTYVDTKLTTYYGKPFLKLGDKIRIYTNETDYFDTYLLKHNFTFDGTFISTIESPVLTEQEIKTKQDVSLKEILKNTQVIVDKQNSKIDMTIEKVEEQVNQISQVFLDIDGIKNTVSNSTSTLENNVDLLKEQMTKLEQKANNLSITITNINQEGVNKVVTSNGFVFDEKGLNLSKEGDAMSAILNWEGLLVKNYDTDLLDARGDRVITENLTVRKYLVVGQHRFEKFTDEKNRKTTGLFWVGDE